MTTASIVFLGRTHDVPPEGVTLGRRADIVLDDMNRLLHRHALALRFAGDVWWLDNIGRSLTASVLADDASVEALVRPGARLALTSPRTWVRLAAGTTVYEFEVVVAVDDTPQVGPGTEADDPTQLPAEVPLSPQQRLVLVALAEPALRDGMLGARRLPTAAAIADRVGRATGRAITEKAVSRTLEHLRGRLLTERGRSADAPGDRSRELVEHAIGRGLVGPSDLPLLGPRRPGE